MGLKFLVEVLANIRLYAKGLQEEYAHPDYSLFRSVELVLKSIEQEENNEVMESTSVNHEGPEPFVTLCNLPEKHNHF